MAHDRLERIGARQLEAADAYLSAHRDHRWRTRRTRSPRATWTTSAWQATSSGASPKGLRYRDEAASAVGRLALLFGSGSGGALPRL
jgi:hypothetical protein